MIDEQKTKTYLWASIIAAVVFGIIISFWYVSSFSKSVLPERSFTVSGEGKIIAVPDVAELSFGVLTEGGKNLASLQKENTEKINRVIAYLKEQGIEDKDIKTEFYNISPRYQYFSCPALSVPEIRPCPPSEIIGYSITQNVSVKIRDLNKAGDIIGGVVDRGANTVSGLSFTVDDPTALQNEAREEAITKAREKAKAVARAGDFRLGKLISIQEGVSLPSPMSLEFLGRGAASSIEPGSQEIRVSVTLVYEIK